MSLSRGVTLGDALLLLLVCSVLFNASRKSVSISYGFRC